MQVDRRAYKVMGIDPGTLSMGWAIGNLDGILELSGSIIMNPKEDVDTRIYKAVEQLALLTWEHNVSLVYCESAIVYGGMQNAMKASRLSGAIGYAIWKTKGGVTHVNYIQNTSVRKILGVPKMDPKEKKRKGAIKANVIKWIQTLMGDHELPYDMAARGEEDRLEAIGIYWAACSEWSRLLLQEE